MGDTCDLIIRGGLVVDGAGGAPFESDVAIAGGRIVSLDAKALRGREEIDARGHIVTPGFIDPHSHYDGHATWENRMRASSAHGVSTAVTGNCGIGFAPCRPQDRAALIEFMEGVEDIPEPVLSAGLPWTWTSFEDYLDVLDGRRFDIDLATQVPHTPVRVNVMGARALNDEPSTAADQAAMARMVASGVRAGAFGFATSRLSAHRSSKGATIPTLHADVEELLAVGRAMQAMDAGVYQLVGEFDPDLKAFDLIRRLVAETGRPLSYTLLQFNSAPGQWRDLLRLTEEAQACGLPIRGQVFARPVGLLFGFDLSLNPFTQRPTYHAISTLPFETRIAELRRPEVRARILAEGQDVPHANPMSRRGTQFDHMFIMDEHWNYEPTASVTIEATATRTGTPAEEIAYDAMLRDDGRGLLYFAAANYFDFSLDPALAMMKSEATFLGLGDAGAHVGIICDANYPTHLLTHWVRDRQGPRIPLEEAVRGLTSKPALALGMADRGRVAVGQKADLNVIDLDRLTLHAPRMVRDLPAGGKRLTQAAGGYAANIVSGQIVYRDGEATGALPGRLVRRGRS